jgi:hypothetical protein
MDDFFYKSLVMNAMHGLLAGDCTSDRKYIDEPGKKKEQKLADDAFKIANEFAKRFNELESKKTG